MLLVIDIGNTNVVVGVYNNLIWQHNWRIQTQPNRMPDEYAAILHILFQEASLGFTDFTDVIISSVVPQLTQGFLTMLKRKTKVPPKLLTSQSQHGLILETNPPESTGTDLIANAVAAFNHFQSDCLVLDFGTATTIMAVKSPGILLGGSIAAGLRTTVNALVSATAQLPSIELSVPSTAIGSNTITAMQAGLVMGHLCMIEGLVKRMKKDLPDAKVIATGGFSDIAKKLDGVIDVVSPLLTLDGLRLISERMDRV